MAWFARSIANTLKFDDDDEQSDEQNHNNQINKQNDDAQEQFLPDSPGRGVKEDLSELTKTLTRQFWGVASFLAPPPPSDSDPHPDPLRSGDAANPEGSGPEAISSGIRSDFAEIGGRFRSGISKLSSNIAVSEITKMASNLLQLGPEDGDYVAARGAVGVTDEVVAFVRDIAMHPETWLDFPLPEDEDDEDFDLSDAQQEHALAVERLAPRLAALRFELCPGYMSEASFWKIYFVLLHPRLDKHDADLLSTPDIMKARASLTYELENRAKAKPEQGDGTHSKHLSESPREESLSVPSTVPTESVSLDKGTLPSDKFTSSTDLETEKYPVASTEIQIVDKSVIEEGPKKQDDQIAHSTSTSRITEEKDEDDGDDWLKEESSEMVGSSRNSVPVLNDEDVSFSDLEEEEEEDGEVPTSYKKVTYGSDSSTKDSRDWVQLGRSSADSTKDIDCVSIERAGSGQVSVHNSETKESNDWLDVDDIDVA